MAGLSSAYHHPTPGFSLYCLYITVLYQLYHMPGLLLLTPLMLGLLRTGFFWSLRTPGPSCLLCLLLLYPVAVVAYESSYCLLIQVTCQRHFLPLCCL